MPSRKQASYTQPPLVYIQAYNMTYSICSTHPVDEVVLLVGGRRRCIGATCTRATAAMGGRVVRTNEIDVVKRLDVDNVVIFADFEPALNGTSNALLLCMQ